MTIAFNGINLQYIKKDEVWDGKTVDTGGKPVRTSIVNFQGWSTACPNALLKASEDAEEITWQGVKGWITSATADQRISSYPNWIINGTVTGYSADLPYKIDIEVEDATGNRGNVMVMWTKGSPGSANVTALTPVGGISFYQLMTVKFGEIPIFSGYVEQYDTWTEDKKVLKPDGSTETVAESWSNIQLIDAWKLINNSALTIEKMETPPYSSEFTKANLWLTLYQGQIYDYPTYYATGNYWEVIGGPWGCISWIFAQCGLADPIYHLPTLSYGNFEFYDGIDLGTYYVKRYFANPTLGEIINFACSLLGCGFHINSAGQFVFGTDNTAMSLGGAFKLTKSGKMCVHDSFDIPERVADTATYEGNLSEVGVPMVGGTIHSVLVSLFNKIESSRGRFNGMPWGNIILAADGTVEAMLASGPPVEG